MQLSPQCIVPRVSSCVFYSNLHWEKSMGESRLFSFSPILRHTGVKPSLVPRLYPHTQTNYNVKRDGIWQTAVLQTASGRSGSQWQTASGRSRVWQMASGRCHLPDATSGRGASGRGPSARHGVCQTASGRGRSCRRRLPDTASCRRRLADAASGRHGV